MRGLLITVLVACYTATDLLTVRCDERCKEKGYAGGWFQEENCLCYVVIPAKDFLTKSGKIPGLKSMPSKKSIQIPYRFDDGEE